jgi:hypothetical protein
MWLVVLLHENKKKYIIFVQVLLEATAVAAPSKA